jgi:hypothetical protein
MTVIKELATRRNRALPATLTMDATNGQNVTLTETELAKILQAHFRRFVSIARLTQDPRTGEPVVRVEFAAPARVARS